MGRSCRRLRKYTFDFSDDQREYSDCGRPSYGGLEFALAARASVSATPPRRRPGRGAPPSTLPSGLSRGDVA